MTPPDLPDEQWTEIVEYLDVNDAGELTFKGFTELYSLQTGTSNLLEGSASRTDLPLRFGQKTTRQRQSRISRRGATTRRRSSG